MPIVEQFGDAATSRVGGVIKEYQSHYGVGCLYGAQYQECEKASNGDWSWLALTMTLY